MEIVEYASSLIKGGVDNLVLAKKKRGNDEKKSGKKRRFFKPCFVRGVNLQKVCEQKFPHIKGIKVGVMVRQAKEQSWACLSEKQQKQFYHLPDSMKQAMGVKRKLRGWKTLRQDGLMNKIDKDGALNRWTVPGVVLEATQGQGIPISCVHQNRRVCFQ